MDEQHTNREPNTNEGLGSKVYIVSCTNYTISMYIFGPKPTAALVSGLAFTDVFFLHKYKNLHLINSFKVRLYNTTSYNPYLPVLIVI